MGGTEYPKIESLLDRDPKTFKVIEGAWRLPEFAYLASCPWLWTEKIDGTNIRVEFCSSRCEKSTAEGAIRFSGRTDAAQLPVLLLQRLMEIFSVDRLLGIFPPDESPWSRLDVCLYGEGYGARIQRGGDRYKPDGVYFALFDIRIGDLWLRFADVQDVASKLGIGCVPVLGRGTLPEALYVTREGFPSRLGAGIAQAEGLVVRPAVDLLDRRGRRLIGKIKTRDF